MAKAQDYGTTAILTDVQEVTPQPEPKSFWQSYKHIIIPIAVIATIATTVAVVLVRYFSKNHDDETPTPNTIPVGDCNFYTDYVKKHPILLEWLSGITCGTSWFLQLSVFEGGYIIGPEGAALLAPALQQLTTLTRISFRGDNIGDIGATAIAPALQHMTGLNNLNLAQNNISDIGVTALAIALQNSKWLQILRLYSNNIGPTGAAALSAVLETLHLLETVNVGDDVGVTGCTSFTNAIHINNPSCNVDCS